MAANRFDTSANQEYVSTYVPKPFELMYKLGMGMKQEHEKQQAESDALADQLNKIKVVNEVLSEGSGDDLGIKSRKIGYGDFKNEVLNKYSQESKRLADEYQATGDADKFKQGIAKQKADFSQDIQKLKIAEANSAAIEEMNKKIRENKDIGIEGNEYVLNPLAEEGRRLLDNPYTTQYQGAAIGDALKIEDEINKSAQHFADQIGQGGVRTDSHGNVIYEKTHGVTAERIKDEVYRSYDKGVGLHTQQQVLRSLRNAGIDPNKEKIIKVPTKFDATGKPTAFEEVKTTEFNDRYNQAKQNYAQAVVAKAEKSVLDQSIHKNWMFADDRKAAADAKKQDYLNNPLDLLHPAAQPPQDLNKNNPFSDLFSFDGKGNVIITPHNDGSMTEKYTYVTQGGETHEGIRTKPGMNDKLITKKVFAANEYYASIGKLDEMKKQFTKDGKLDVIAMSEQGLKDMAQNYKSGNLNSLSIAVFPEAVQNQMTNYILPKSTVAANGDVKVLNAGMISGMTLLDANGNNIPESEDNKIAMLTNASIIGPSYVHPDALRVSLPDGSEILLKTNSSNLANANSEITKFVQEASKAMTAPKSHAQQVYDDKLEYEQNKNTISKLEKSNDPLDKYKLNLIKSKLEPLNNLRKQGFISSTSTTLPNGDEVYVYTKYSVDGKPVDQKAIIMNPGIGGIRETTISNVAAEAYSYNFKVPAYNANVRNKVAKDVETFETTEDEQ